MESLELEIAEWRSFVAEGPAVDGRDVEELEAHLRDQIADLNAAGLAADEAFLIAVKRMEASMTCPASSHANTAAGCGGSSSSRAARMNKPPPSNGPRRCCSRLRRP